MSSTARPVVDYFLATVSPYVYLGHERFVAIARARGAQVRVRPADFGPIFAASGGLPLGKRAPQRQAYRLVELRRFSEHMGLPMNLQPKYFPAAGDPSSRLIIATDLHAGPDAALGLVGAVSRAVWVQERNVADEAVLAELLAEQGLSAQLLAQSHDAAVQARYAADTQAAIDAGVFGAPSYVVDGEIFWGQDRLDFLDRRLAR